MSSQATTPSAVLSKKNRSGGTMPRYEQIASKLISDIRSGLLPPDSRLPSEQELQREYSVSRVTIRQALGILEYQGWIRRFRRRGSFVTGTGTDFRGGERPEGLQVVQFLHSGFDKADALPFSRGEVEAAEKYYASRGIAVAWNALDFRFLLDDQLPPAVRSGSCRGILLDGHLTPLHVEMVRRWGKPFVVLGQHQLGTAVHDVHHVGVDSAAFAEAAVEAVRRLDVERLLSVDNALINPTFSDLIRALDSRLAAEGLPPLSLLPMQSALAPGFLRSVDRLGKRCGLLISSHELTGILLALMQDDPDWQRHPFIAPGFPFPAEGLHADCTAWIEISPRKLVEAGCEILDLAMADPSLAPMRRSLVPTLRMPSIQPRSPRPRKS
ncbi:MAG TPA: GntR family transcriptional regulator [Terrimicrobiaceae bacterium]|nr:GntR family transcriptional regulator [Terrimicrobiaceae bacterium]